jgi:hypothetical protein
MSAIGLVLGTLAFLVMRYGDTFGRFEKLTTAVAARTPDVRGPGWGYSYDAISMSEPSGSRQ